MCAYLNPKWHITIVVFSFVAIICYTILFWFLLPAFILLPSGPVAAPNVSMCRWIWVGSHQQTKLTCRRRRKRGNKNTHKMFMSKIRILIFENPKMFLWHSTRAIPQPFQSISHFFRRCRCCCLSFWCAMGQCRNCRSKLNEFIRSFFSSFGSAYSRIFPFCHWDLTQ